MDVFDHATVLDERFVQLRAAQAGADEHEQGPYPFASRTQDILPDSRNDRDIREEVIFKRPLDLFQVGSEDLGDFFIIHNMTLHGWPQTY